MTSRRVVAVAALLAVAIVACGDGGPSRPDVMAAIGAEAAVPAFEAFADGATAMAAEIDAACAVPDDATIAAALAAVDTARDQWLSTQGMWTGPVMQGRSAGAIDWAVDAAGIEELVAGSDELTVAFVADQVGSDNRGLRALRGVLARDDARQLLGAEHWCAYLASVARVVAEEGDAVLAEWTRSYDGGPPFVDVIADPDQAQEWLSMLVNDDIQVVRLTTGEPSAQGDVPAPDPAADRAAQLRGVAAVTAGLAPLLGDELGGALQSQLAAAIAAYDAGDVEEGRALATDVERTLTADVAGRLDVAIGFSDADGDGSG